MCDFLDQNGDLINPGDKIEYWSAKSKDWILCEVEEVEILKTIEYQTKNIKTTVKILVRPLNTTGGRDFYRNKQKLAKSANVRKLP